MKTLKICAFWALSCTWGAIMTTAGLFVSLAMLVSGHKPHAFGYGFYFEIGENWGGVELGPIFLTNKNPTLAIKQHEAGHGLQNIWWGPLMPFVISIPSAVRYWFRVLGCDLRKACDLIVYVFVGVVAILLIGTAIWPPVDLIIPLCVVVLIGLYCLGLIWWLIKIEAPQYEKKVPAYNSIWFEKQASSLGEKHWPKNEI